MGLGWGLVYEIEVVGWGRLSWAGTVYDMKMRIPGSWYQSVCMPVGEVLDIVGMIPGSNGASVPANFLPY